MGAVDVEVGVEGEDLRLFVQLRHADEAGVGKGHGRVQVLGHERSNGYRFSLQLEARPNDVPRHQVQNQLAAPWTSHEVASFADDGFASSQGRGDFGPGFPCPRMELVVLPEVRHQGPGVEKDASPHLPKSLMYLGL